MDKMNNKYLINSRLTYGFIVSIIFLYSNFGWQQPIQAQVRINTIETLAYCGIKISLSGQALHTPYKVKLLIDGLVIDEITNVYPSVDNSLVVAQPNYRKFDVQIVDALGHSSPIYTDFQLGTQLPIITKDFVSIPKGHCYDFFDDCLFESGYYEEVLTSVYGCDSIIQLTLSVEGDLVVNYKVTYTPCNEQRGIISARVTGGFGPYSYQWSNNGTSNIINNLAIGTYALTVTDQRGYSVINNNIKVRGISVFHDLGVIENCYGNPLRIGGKNYQGKSTGVYSDTLLTATGCDSIITFDLVVYDLKAEVIKSNLSCFIGTGTAVVHALGGQDPYTYHWNDQLTPTTDSVRNNLAFGNYQVKIKGAFGCEVIKVVNFQHDLTRDTIIANICDGAPYLLNGEPFDQPGIYDRTIINGSSCSSEVTLILDVIHTSFDYNSIPSDCGKENGRINLVVSNQKDYRFRWSSGHETADIEGLSAGTYTVSLTNSITDCTIIKTIDLDNRPVDTTYLNALFCPSTCFAVGDSLLCQSGLYSILLKTEKHGCDSLVILNLKLEPPVEIALYPINEDCGTSNGQLSTTVSGGIEPYSYTWRDGNNNSLGNTRIINQLSTGNYFLEVKDSLGCIYKKDTTLTSIELNEIYIDTVICEGICFKIGRECYDNAGFYSQTLTNSFGCDSVIALNLQVHRLVVDIDYTPSNCGATNGAAFARVVTSHHGGPYSFFWTSKNLDRTIQGPALNNLSSGTYYLKVNDGVTPDGFACTIMDSVIIKNLPIDSTFINICEGTCFTIGDIAYCEPGLYRDTLTSVMGCDSIVGLIIEKDIFYPQNCTVEFVNPCSSEVYLSACQPFGTTGYWSSTDIEIEFETPENNSIWAYRLQEEENTIIWNLEKGACSLADTAYVFYEGAPIAIDDYFELAYQADTILEVLANDDLYPAPSSVTISTEADASMVTIINDTTLQFKAPSGYFGVLEFQYMVCNTHCMGDISSRNIGMENCDTATVQIKINPYQTDHSVPDIITPNGDGLNETWIVDTLFTDPTSFPDNEVLIFNRWGSQVFRAKPYNNDWAGTNQNGQPLPESTYYYILYLNIGEGEIRKGEILVNR